MKNMFTIERHGCIGSTNDRAKQLARDGKRNVCVIAERQTGGRGRMGRQFFSPEGAGLYVSLLLSPSVRGEDSALLTTYAAVAVAQTVEELTGAKTAVKWVNDVYLGGKKICGILTEGAIDFATGQFSYAVIGIGINVRRQNFPEELAAIASDIETETGVALDREQLLARLLERFEGSDGAISDKSFMQFYRSRCFVIGKTVDIYRGNERFSAEVLDVNDRGELVVRTNGTIQLLQSGELSVRVK